MEHVPLDKNDQAILMPLMEGRTPLTARQISNITDIPRPVVSKNLKRLKEAGIVASIFSSPLKWSCSFEWQLYTAPNANIRHKLVFEALLDEFEGASHQIHSEWSCGSTKYIDEEITEWRRLYNGQ